MKKIVGVEVGVGLLSGKSTFNDSPHFERQSLKNIEGKKDKTWQSQKHLNNFSLRALRQIPKVALYTSSSTIDENTTVYTATNEIVATGYTAGGAVLSGATVDVDGTGYALNVRTYLPTVIS